jgi:hypothetical protein
VIPEPEADANIARIYLIGVGRNAGRRLLKAGQNHDALFNGPSERADLPR